MPLSDFVLNGSGGSGGPGTIPAGSSPVPVGQSNSPFMTPPFNATPGGMAGAQEYQRKVGEEQANEAVKAIGSAQYLSLVPHAVDVIKQYPGVFGPNVGTEWWNQHIRDPLSLVSKEAAQNKVGHDQVAAQVKALSQMGLKAAYGGKITNVELNQNEKIHGGLLSASSDSAAQTILEQAQRHAATLQNAVVSGYLSPQQLMNDPNMRKGIYNGITHKMLDPKYFLPVKQTAAEAHALGSGAMFLTPDGKVMRVP